MANSVRSGDPSNIEGQAAKIYWRSWLGPERPFRRDPNGDGINGLLNYGYAIVRAAIGRSILGAGLMPMFGINHSNRSNAFCLADDLIEPIRPLVDVRVRALVRAGREEVVPDAKRELLSVLNETVEQDEQRSPLQIAIQRLAYSLVHCYEGRSKELLIPTAIDDA